PPYFCVAFDAMRGVDEPGIHSACERGTRQSRSDRLRDLGNGDGAGKALYRTVRKADIRHTLIRKAKPRVERRFACVPTRGVKAAVMPPNLTTVGRRDWNRTND